MLMVCAHLMVTLKRRGRSDSPSVALTWQAIMWMDWLGNTQQTDDDFIYVQHQYV